MTLQTDAQATASTNAAADKTRIGTGGTTQGGSHDAAVVTGLVSGTAVQLDTQNDVYAYVDINTAAALAIAMGPTSAVATAIMASKSSAIGTTMLYVPAGWYVKFTGTVANFTVTTVKR